MPRSLHYATTTTRYERRRAGRAPIRAKGRCLRRAAVSDRTDRATARRRAAAGDRTDRLRAPRQDRQCPTVAVRTALAARPVLFQVVRRTRWPQRRRVGACLCVSGVCRSCVRMYGWVRTGCIMGVRNVVTPSRREVSDGTRQHAAAAHTGRASSATANAGTRHVAGESHFTHDGRRAHRLPSARHVREVAPAAAAVHIDRRAVRRLCRVTRWRARWWTGI